MNRAPQRPRPRYDEYRMPPRRPPQKQNNFAMILAALMAVIVILVAVIVIISVAKRPNNGEDPSHNGSSTGDVYTEDDTSPPQSTPVVSVKDSHHILIDAGHGFDDNGCTSKYMAGKYEKEITLAVAEYLKQELELKGYKVSFTHDGVSYIDEPDLISQLNSLGLDYKPDKITDNNIFHAYERTMYANILNKSEPVSAFLSLHVNSNVDSDKLSDFTIDYCGENNSTESSGKLVDSVLSSLKSAFPARQQRRYQDSWEESFVVTKYSVMPSFLLEMGYATTPSDAAEIIDPEWQKQLAAALAEGIDSYFTEAN